MKIAVSPLVHETKRVLPLFAKSSEYHTTFDLCTQFTGTVEMNTARLYLSIVYGLILLKEIGVLLPSVLSYILLSISV